MTLISVLLATAATALWLGYCGSVFVTIVNSRGNWYDELRTGDRENNFRNRLRITVSERLHLPRAIALFVVSTISVFVFVFLLVEGIVGFLIGCGVVL